jgi:hypothetical protein
LKCQARRVGLELGRRNDDPFPKASFIRIRKASSGALEWNQESMMVMMMRGE